LPHQSIGFIIESGTFIIDTEELPIALTINPYRWIDVFGVEYCGKTWSSSSEPALKGFAQISCDAITFYLRITIM
jgi:hypothetical protein